MKREPASARLDEVGQNLLLRLARTYIAREGHERICLRDGRAVCIVLGDSHPEDALMNVKELQDFEPGEVEVVKSPPDDEIDIDTPARGSFAASFTRLRHYFFPAM